ncbi:polymorphic toxin type 46 domain-containing protein [Simiduia aestuariiviva]|uniref:Bacterial toxin 46 domain-containing protein n=1 Tax=Simiduia aestuariiviva TaxID=1510459 RepID=A0A839UP13_9GAMM|nr:polymorphic toxin type 46 domain-containing protein [Simiduia aestuariiviva]MBB3167496.1 hypothetical protein [Simiduia aestuariiviva]
MSLSLTDPQGRRFRIVHGWGTGPCKSKNLYRSHPEAEAFVERLSSEQLSDIVRCFFGGSDHRPRHLRETPVNRTATCRQPVPTKAHTAADRIAAAICNAHLVVQPDTRLQPVDDPRSKLRMEIRQTLSAILLDERQEAARHQALLDQESAINKGLIYTGAAMTGLRDAAWGLLCWAKEVSDLVNPAVRLQHRFTALTTAAAADSDKLQVFADTLRREEWREVVEVIGFDPSKITDEHMAQAMDALDLVMSDASLRQSLKTFSWDYIKAQHAVELTNAGGAAVFEIALTAILAALTGGIGAVASIASKARHVTKFKKLGELLVDFAKASKKLAAHAKARAKQAAQTVAKNFDDLKTDMPAVDRKGERPKGEKVKSLTDRELAAKKGTSPTIVKARKKVAYDFYVKQGMPKHKISSHLAGIDFDKPVEISNINVNTTVHQYQSPGNPQGGYYAPPGSKATNLGISEYALDRGTNTIVKKQVNVYTTNQNVEVLKSTAAKIDDDWSIPNKVISTKGGATQYFTFEGTKFTKI